MLSIEVRRKISIPLETDLVYQNKLSDYRKFVIVSTIGSFMKTNILGQIGDLYIDKYILAHVKIKHNV